MTVPPPAILHIVGIDEAENTSLAALLSTAGYATRTYPSAEALLASDISGTSSVSKTGLPMPPGVIIAEMQMPGTDGTVLLQGGGSPANAGALPVVLLTAHATVLQAVEAMKAGAVDVLEKPLDDAALFAAVETALERFKTTMKQSAVRTEAQQRLQTLLPRERDVLKRLLVRSSSKAIAADLGLSPRTVELYRARITAKTRAEGLSELVRLAIEAGVQGV